VNGSVTVENPYFRLHKEFKMAGADVLLSSGQACVVFGIAAFSKDGDWIVRENNRTCAAVLKVLSSHEATYRLGVPLDPLWLRLGLTSHFEFKTSDGLRMRTDFCSRPPRVPDVEMMWKRAVRSVDIDLVDVQSLVQLKQTRRVRDYSMVGALAEVAGLDGNSPELALNYLQDYELLSKAVHKWPKDAEACTRTAVELLLAKASRASVVAAIAIEQDARMQKDQARIKALQKRFGRYAREFSRLRTVWRREGSTLPQEHKQLLRAARSSLENRT
jgi:hypothetical protein